MDMVKNASGGLKKFMCESHYIREIMGTMCFMMFTGLCGDNSAIKVGVIYAIMYATSKACFGSDCRATFNPALVMADIMSSVTGVGAGILTMICQGFGAFIGYLIVGAIDADKVANHADPNAFDFYTVLVTEAIGASIMVWLWLDIHSKARGDQWKESFYGFAPGLMYFIAMSVLKGDTSLNPARFEAKWAAKDLFHGEKEGEDPAEGGNIFKYFITDNFWGTGFSAWNMTFYFAPIVAAFMTSLVYAYVNKN